MGAIWWSEAVIKVRAMVIRCLLAVVFRLPYRFWKGMMLSALRESQPVYPRPERVERILQGVEWTDRWGPGRCMERSLTAWWLLRRQAACCVRLAVAFQGKNDPFAHACVELGGKIVFGEPRQSVMSMLDVSKVPLDGRKSS